MSKITMQMVKSLRQRTGAGINDCKKALQEADGDEEKAVEIIQKKGLAKAAKKAGAVAAEGMVAAYVHPGDRIGVLLEVNCQTDFVARNEEFRQFVADLAMQIAAMSPQYVRREEVPEAVLAKQREIFLAQIDEEEQRTGKKKPEQARARIVEGKLEKWLKEVCLVDQGFIHDDKKTVEQITTELTARLGEKIQVRRFTRYELGEGIEKAKKKDFAEEVAETIAKS